jgi:polysaccharide export outer membrane protein
MHYNLLILIALFLVTSCSGQWSEYPQSQYTASTKEQLIESGDSLSITVFGEEALSDQYLVLNNGTIQVPLIGAVVVEKKTLDQAQELLAESFKKEGYLVNPKITLSIAQSRTVKIMGEILDAGEYPYTEDMTILDLVARAGGFSYRANQNRFDIVRKDPNGSSETVLDAVLSSRLRPGDIIRVKERYF